MNHGRSLLICDCLVGHDQFVSTEYRLCMSADIVCNIKLAALLIYRLLFICIMINFCYCFNAGFFVCLIIFILLI